MSRIHKIGDICIGQNLVLDVSYNGMECEIIGEQEWREWENEDGQSGSCIAYLVRWENGDETIQKHFELRAKKPPAVDLDKIVSWEDVGWSPSEVYT